MKDFYTSCEASRVLSYYLFMQHGVAKTSQPNKTITWNASSASFFGTPHQHQTTDSAPSGGGKCFMAQISFFLPPF